MSDLVDVTSEFAGEIDFDDTRPLAEAIGRGLIPDEWLRRVAPRRVHAVARELVGYPPKPPPARVNGSRPTNGSRRSRAEIEWLKDRIFAIVATAAPMTVRQVFYRGVGFGLWSKTEAAYKNVVVRLLGQLRTDGEMPYAWIADSARWMRKPDTFASAAAALRRTAQTYRRALWATQPDYVEVWLEKEALVGVLVAVTDEWDVPLMVTRSYPSLSFLHSAAETIADAARAGHQPVVLYVGDHDPSGLDIERNVWERLEDLACCPIEVTRLAVTPGQIAAYDLPTRPTKPTDARTRTWAGGGSVEVDAIDPDQLRRLLRDAIEQRVDQPALSLLRTVKAEERTMLHRLLTREFPA